MVSRFTRNTCKISCASSMSPSWKMLKTSGESTVNRILRRTSLKLLRHYCKSSHRDPTSWLLGITRRMSTRYACDAGGRELFHSQMEGRYIRFWVTSDARDNRFSSSRGRHPARQTMDVECNDISTIDHLASRFPGRRPSTKRATGS